MNEGYGFDRNPLVVSEALKVGGGTSPRLLERRRRRIQLLRNDCGIARRRLRVRVSQQLLHICEVHPSTPEQSRLAVTQLVGIESFDFRIHAGTQPRLVERTH